MNMNITVNGTPIDEQAVAREVQYHRAADLDTARDEAGKALVIQALLMEEAVQEGLVERGSDPSEDSAIQALLERHASVDEPSEERCRKLFAKARERYRAPDLFEATHILLAAAPDHDEDRQKAELKAKELITKLEAMPDLLAKLAAEHSDCPSKDNGGSLGQFSNGDTVEEFETFLYNLEPGQLCPVPVATRFGYHVLRLDHREEGRELPFEAAREAVRDDILSADWQRVAKTYVRSLIDKADISGINMDSAHASDEPWIHD